MAKDFRMRTDDDGEAVDCSACGYPAPLVLTKSIATNEDGALCRLCYSTMSGVHFDDMSDEAKILHTICYVGNAILEAIHGATNA